MKKSFLTIFMVLGIAFSILSQEEVLLKSDGVVVPRIEPVLVVNPEMGQLVYAPSSNTFWYYDGSGWKELTGPWIQSGSDVFYDSGNVGIGNIAPGEALEVTGNAIVNPNGPETYGGLSVTADSSVDTVYIKLDNNATKGRAYSLSSIGTTVGLEGRFLISDATDADPTNHEIRMVIDSFGNVGISKVTPVYKLDVNGNMAADNQVTIIPLWQAGTNYNMNNTSGSDLTNCESGLDPAIYDASGNIEVKLMIRITSTSAGTNNFQLRTHNGITQSFPIVNTDSWTFSNTQSGIVASSPWKDWAAGTNLHEVHLFGWVSNGSTNFNSAYLMIRPNR